MPKQHSKHHACFCLDSRLSLFLLSVQFCFVSVKPFRFYSHCNSQPCDANIDDTSSASSKLIMKSTMSSGFQNSSHRGYRSGIASSSCLLAQTCRGPSESQARRCASVRASPEQWRNAEFNLKVQSICESSGRPGIMTNPSGLAPQAALT